MLDFKAMFQGAKDEGRMAIIGYLPVGFPDPDTFIRAVEVSSEAGMDILEVGMPAEDPKFDGEVIRTAQEKIRRMGIEIDRALELGAFAVCNAGCAGLAMMYGEDLLKYGVERMVDRCAVLGMAGILSVAMDVETWKNTAQLSRTASLEVVPLITPDMDDVTIADILPYAGGYLYVVSRKGPSGGHAEFNALIEERIRHVKHLAEGRNLPVAIGFGIRTPEDVTRLRGIGADAIIVGTALIEAAIEGEGAVRDFISALRHAACF
jgi:tryptophan synthase alpha chain